MISAVDTSVILDYLIGIRALGLIRPISLGSLDQVDALLRGDVVDAPRIAQRENLNYNQALDTATTFALTPSFEWTEATIRVINHQLLRDLPEDRQGRYREEAVTVGPYSAPDHHIVPNLMAELVSWLRSARETHPLVRVALLHPLRTRFVADAIGRAMPTARALLNAMTRAGWLEMRGRTRGAAYYPGARTQRRALRSPEIVQRYVRGLTLGLDTPQTEPSR